jgi:hypothetical protein
MNMYYFSYEKKKEKEKEMRVMLFGIWLLMT